MYRWPTTKRRKNQVFLEKTNGQTAILNIITYTKRKITMASRVRSPNDFLAEDARILFKLATRMKETCVNLKPRIDENRQTVPKMRFLLATLTYISHWHGNVRLNHDSNSLRRTLNASRVSLNLVDVHGGQSARDNKSHIRTPRAQRM